MIAPRQFHSAPSPDTDVSFTEVRIQKVSSVGFCLSVPGFVKVRAVQESSVVRAFPPGWLQGRLRRVREACLESISGEEPPQQIVTVRPEILRADEKSSSDTQLGLNISAKGFSVHVTESAPMAFLAAVLEVIQNAE